MEKSNIDNTDHIEEYGKKVNDLETVQDLQNESSYNIRRLRTTLEALEEDFEASNDKNRSIFVRELLKGLNDVDGGGKKLEDYLKEEIKDDEE